MKKGVLKHFAKFAGKHMLEAAARGVLYKKLFLNISQYSQESTCVGVYFYLKETPAQVFFYEYCVIFKSTCFEEICERLLLTCASVSFLIKLQIDLILQSTFWKLLLLILNLIHYNPDLPNSPEFTIRRSLQNKQSEKLECFP